VTAKQKLGALQHSINQAEMGLTKIVHCPYCQADLDFTPPSTLDDDWKPPTCCAEFALAVIAILQRKEQQELKDLADRIGENVGGTAVFN
jgi:hypothetical protein